MPIDPNIALGYRGIEVPNPLAGMAQVTQIQTAQRQGEMAQMQLEELKRDREEMLQFQQAWAAKGGNPDLNALADMMIKSPKMMAKGIELKQKLQEQAQFDSLLKQTFGGAAPAAAPAAAPTAAGPTPIMSRLPEGSLGGAVPGAVSPAVAFAQSPRIVRTIEGANTPDSEPVFAPRSENALAPQPAPANALTPPSTAAAPTNQLAAPGQRSPEELRSMIAAVAQSRDPRAKALLDMLQSELTEASKTHNVAPGTQVMRNGKVVYTAPESATTTQREYDQAVRQGFKGTLLDYKKQVAEAGRPVTKIEIPPGEHAEQKGRGEALVSHERDVRAAADAARRSSVSLESAQAALDKGFRTGFGTEAKVAAANVLSSVFGMKDASKYATTGQLFNQTIMEQVLARQLQQKGVQTNQDAERIKAAGVQLGNTVEANQFMLDVARAQNERAIAQDKFYRDWLKNPDNKGSLRGAEDAWLEAEGNRSLFDAPALQKYKSLGRSAASAAPAAAPAVVDYGSLK